MMIRSERIKRQEAQRELGPEKFARLRADALAFGSGESDYSAREYIEAVNLNGARVTYWRVEGRINPPLPRYDESVERGGWS